MDIENLIEKHLSAGKFHLLPQADSRATQIKSAVTEVYQRAVDAAVNEDPSFQVPDMELFSISPMGRVTPVPGASLDWVADRVTSVVRDTLIARSEDPSAFLPRLASLGDDVRKLATDVSQEKADRLSMIEKQVDRAVGRQGVLLELENFMGRASARSTQDLKNAIHEAAGDRDEAWRLELGAITTVGEFATALVDPVSLEQRTGFKENDLKALSSPYLRDYRSELSPYGVVAQSLRESGLLSGDIQETMSVLDVISGMPSEMKTDLAIQKVCDSASLLNRAGGVGRHLICAAIKKNGVAKSLNAVEKSSPAFKETCTLINQRVAKIGAGSARLIEVLAGQLAERNGTEVPFEKFRLRSSVEKIVVDLSHPNETSGSAFRCSPLGLPHNADQSDHLIDAIFDKHLPKEVGDLPAQTDLSLMKTKIKEAASEAFNNNIRPGALNVQIVIDKMDDLEPEGIDQALTSVLMAPACNRLLSDISREDPLTCGLFRIAASGNGRAQMSLMDPETFARIRGMTGAQMSQLLKDKPGFEVDDLMDPDIAVLAQDPRIEQGRDLRRIFDICAPLAQRAGVDAVTMLGALGEAGFDIADDPLGAGELSRIYAGSLSGQPHPSVLAKSYLEVLEGANLAPESVFDDPAAPSREEPVGIET